jgi:quercetin dioxygenase-like cupin family protein
MIRCIKLWTGADQRSHFEEGFIDLEPGVRGDALSGKFPITSASFHETDADPKLGWHPDPARQLVITLSGTLEFETPDGRFVLRPGDVLFTEDTSGAGHNWKVLGNQAWRRVYTILDPKAVVPYRPAAARPGAPSLDECSANPGSGGMIRCVRIWTEDDQNSHFEEGYIDLTSGGRDDRSSALAAAASISFQETASGGAFAWHTAPIRQLVVTLGGTLDFRTRDGEHFLIHPGNILLAEDTVGSGHSWKLTDDSSWRRAYVVLQPGAAVPFRARKLRRATA